MRSRSADRTPAGFTVRIKAYSLLTGHPTRVASIYKDLRPQTGKTTVYPGDQAERTQVLMNNCYGDASQRNAATLIDFLENVEGD